MNILTWLLSFAAVFVLVFIAIYVWAVRHHQFDDLNSPAKRIFFDDIPDHSSKDRI